nr:hypothetical protein [Lachnospiraceae bacterium]
YHIISGSISPIDTMNSLQISLSCAATIFSAPGDYQITGSYSNNNYDITFENGTLTITSETAATTENTNTTVNETSSNGTTINGTYFSGVVITTITTQSGLSVTKRSYTEGGASIKTVTTSRGGIQTAEADIYYPNSEVGNSRISIPQTYLDRAKALSDTTNTIVTIHTKDGDLKDINLSIDIKYTDEKKVIYKKTSSGYVMTGIETSVEKLSGQGNGIPLTGGTYESLTDAERKSIDSAIMHSVKTNSKVSISKDKKKKLTLDGYGKSSIKNISYRISNANKARVNSNGKIVAKKKGTIVLTTYLTFKNGESKTLKTKVKIK